jgi:cyclopropane-fatty-acyl-phospholipid synthase
LVKRDHRVLDIGSGWGGLALYLAEICGGRVTGVTLSHEQLARAKERAAEKGLNERAEFRLLDYRDLRATNRGESFDRIVSVGMFEHVGVGYYEAFFRKCAELLADDGVILLHSIGRSEGPNVTNPWIAKYIFPGGYIPAMSEVLPAIERAGLLVTDIEVLRLHYAETLKAWRDRFLAHRDDVLKLYDERFLRMWEFYLCYCEGGFEERQIGVVQALFEKPGARREPVLGRMACCTPVGLAWPPAPAPVSRRVASSSIARSGACTHFCSPENPKKAAERSGTQEPSR